MQNKNKEMQKDDNDTQNNYKEIQKVHMETEGN